MRATSGFLGALPPGHRSRLRAMAREAAFPVDFRIFEEGGRADRFWVVRTGSVTLELRPPGHRLSSLRPASVESVGPGELLGCSWLFPPYLWRLGARAASPVRALEFDARAVRALCEEDHVLGHAIVLAVTEVITGRLHTARTRLLDSRGPQNQAPR
ncbi:cyclic nucleotide-binding domain-containing protein [Streptomyces sp. ODS28]|uniref:Crp/Fnr family transcriptional regulator n=1 Tax=Streptomyces sp. ODS28 TaxID=3136688 RepID=UPI0031EE8E05